ncbi:toll/interleukin-1 receptor domain-containing protein [Hymenobacter busanensis]|uniref:Toll/interleukin-1 receptor domain-containing protein n=1 Tax=Hymenobacter busanensis TaxID=2607656 RepID=A0A7L4ZWU5_9BACT|nr:toll/interleukin-1 receptor domain-containing protein [Hymenobacter busanensis]KAA9327234.1 toll/interleukin-1 receptor domain-containing protein [Hymenobacter busanensis]QHJ05900.1 TIR domain-containing protein [Hymenobacter busanensis]
MNIELKIKRLERVLDMAAELNGKTIGNSDFKAWQTYTTSVFNAVFGEEAFQTKHFKSIKFIPHSAFQLPGETEEDYKKRRVTAANYGLNIVKGAIKGYLVDLNDEKGHIQVSQSPAALSTSYSKVKRVFVSHASKDVNYVEELIDLLKLIGLHRDQVFCTSVKGYGIPLGSNFLSELKERINDDVLVLFVFSPNFYASPVCLAEMGAAWALSKEHIPIVIPPFKFSDIKGVLPHTQGLMINDKLELNALADRVEELFKQPSHTTNPDWERSRDRILERINNLIYLEQAIKDAEYLADELEKSDKNYQKAKKYLNNKNSRSN